MRRPSLVKLAAALAACAGLAIAGVSIASGGSSPAKVPTKSTKKAAPSLVKTPGVAQRPRAEPPEKGEVETAEKGEVETADKGEVETAENGEPAEKGSEAAGDREGDGDSAVQAAACQKAGLDPNAENVEYDDETGTCSIDNGGDSD